jgi:hypothetical protein
MRDRELVGGLEQKNRVCCWLRQGRQRTLSRQRGRQARPIEKEAEWPVLNVALA